MTDVIDITVSTYQQAREAFRQKELRQALYDEGDVVMSDVLVNLHGADHRLGGVDHLAQVEQHLDEGRRLDADLLGEVGQ